MVNIPNIPLFALQGFSSACRIYSIIGIHYVTPRKSFCQKQIQWQIQRVICRDTLDNFMRNLWLTCGCGLLARKPGIIPRQLLGDTPQIPERVFILIWKEHCVHKSGKVENNPNIIGFLQKKHHAAVIFQSTFTPWWHFTHTWCGVNKRTCQAKSIKTASVLVV